MNSVLLRSSCSFLNSQCSHGFVKFATKFNALRPISSTASALKKDDYPAPPDPIHRTLNTLYNDLKAMKSRILQMNAKDTEEPEKLEAAEFQTHCDVLILGGGGTGSAISYWLKKRARDGLKVVVVENDTVYTNSSCMGLNQQFSLPENIQIANYSAEFMRNVKAKLGDFNLNFTPCGTLILSSSEEDAEVLSRISKIQNELGVRNEILSQEKIKSRFPWMKTDDIILGYHSLENDGYFDPLALLFGYRNKASEYGAHFVEAELVDFEFQVQSNVLVEKEEGKSYNSLDKVVLRMPDGEIRTIKFAICVIATESKTNDVCRLARIGCAPGILSVPLTVESRKRYSSIFNLRDNIESNFLSPLTVDPNGTCFRQEGLGGSYFCSRNLSNSNTEETSPDVEVLKTLRNRVPAFQDANILESWVDSYEINTFDDNGIIGPHPYYNNLYVAVGFNAHGIQQTPAIARAMSELIIDGQFRTIDLTRLGFDRLIVDQPLYEMIST